jgi:isopropylmalate/homocitrate/citramalate synthase
MTDLPTRVHVHEEGPREGFQIEPGPIAVVDKIRLIEALSGTGLRHIQVCSFVNPRLVPGWADADAVVEGFKASPGVDYTALWFKRCRAGAGARLSWQARDQRLDRT